MRDLIIVGSGPAGLAAAIYAARAKIDSLMLEKAGFGGGAVLNTYEVDNYPGLPGESGFSLAQKLEDHAKKVGAAIETAEVNALEEMDGGYRVCCEEGEYEAKSIILATGAQWLEKHFVCRRPSVPRQVVLCCTVHVLWNVSQHVCCFLITSIPWRQLVRFLQMYG